MNDYLRAPGDQEAALVALRALMRLTGLALLLAAGWHYGGVWGVVVVFGWVLCRAYDAPSRRPPA